MPLLMPSLVALLISSAPDAGTPLPIPGDMEVLRPAIERNEAGLRNAPAARPEDVASIDALMSALYRSISGPAGAPRDWDRVRSFFHPSARMVPLHPAKSGGATRLFALALSPDEYISRAAQSFRAQDFYELEVGRRVDGFGTLVNVLSAYEARRSPEGPAIRRGVNSLVLFNDGTRWWILQFTWLDEKEARLKVPLPFEKAKR